MLRYKEKLVVDGKGKRVSVILDIEECNKLMDDLEECGLVRAFDEAMAANEVGRPLEDAIADIRRKRK